MNTIPVTRIFWPSHLSGAPSGFIVGWNVKSFICCVATVVSNIGQLLEILQSVKEDPSLNPAHHYCKGPPTVLGEWKKDINVESSEETRVHARQADFWIRVYETNSHPVLENIRCFNQKYASPAHIVLFQAPDELHSLNLAPICLDGTREAGCEAHLKYDSWTYMDYVIQQINGVHAIAEAIEQRMETEEPVQKKPKCGFLLQTLHSIRSFALQILIYILFGCRACMDIILRVAHRPFPSHWRFRNLMTLSSVAQQLELQFTGYILLPVHYLGMKRTWKSRPSVLASKIHFYNTVWLVILDLSLGMIAALYILTHTDELAAQWETLWHYFHTKLIRNYATWLMGWPGGLKLNENLDRYLGTVCLTMFDLWSAILRLLVPYIRYGLCFIALTGVFGLSMILTVISDLSSLVTLHLFLLYMAAARLYHAEVHVLSTLWKLFTGRKFNVLRQRVDSCSYDIDQLLLGTLGFTLLAFLLPTILVYYTYLICIRLLILIVQLGLSALVAVLNHFPLYSLFIYLTDNKQFSGGIYFQMRDDIMTTINSAVSDRQVTSSLFVLGVSSSEEPVAMKPKPKPSKPFAALRKWWMSKGPESHSVVTNTPGSVYRGFGGNLGNFSNSPLSAPGSPPLTARGYSPAPSGRNSLAHSWSIPSFGSYTATNADAQPAQTYLELKTLKYPVGLLFYQYKTLLANIFNITNLRGLLRSFTRGRPIPPIPVLQLTALEKRPSLSEFWLFLKLFIQGRDAL